MQNYTSIKKTVKITLFLSALLSFLSPIVYSASFSHQDDDLSKQKQETVGNGDDKNLEQLTQKDKEEFEKLLEKALGVSLFEEKQRASSEILKYKWRTRPGKSIIRVYATSFGKPGNEGESRHFKDGSKVRRGIVAAALPDPSAIGKWVEVRRINEKGKKTDWVKMKVKDLGPWFRDDPYWKKKSKQPRAVLYFKKKKQRFDGRVVINPAGIDITPWGWQKLGVTTKKSYNHSQYVEWRFTG